MEFIIVFLRSFVGEVEMIDAMEAIEGLLKLVVLLRIAVIAFKDDEGSVTVAAVASTTFALSDVEEDDALAGRKFFITPPMLVVNLLRIPSCDSTSSKEVFLLSGLGNLELL
jgi:hypothetical protein